MSKTITRLSAMFALLVALLLCAAPAWGDTPSEPTTVGEGGDYPTLAAAMQTLDGKAEAQLLLVSDLTVSESAVLPEGAYVSIDLGGHAVSGANLIGKPILKATEGSTLVVKNGTLRDGTGKADVMGSVRDNAAGGIYGYAADVTVEGVKFLDNAELSSVGYTSSSIFVYKGSLTVRDCTFDKTPEAQGQNKRAAVGTEYATVRISDSAFHNHSQALSIHDNNATVVNTDFSNNTSPSASGVVRYTGVGTNTRVLFEGCTFKKNSVGSNLDPIFLLEGGSSWSNVTLRNCEITDNTSSSGTIVRTTSGFSGSGWNVLTLENTLIADNTSIDAAVEIGSYTRFIMNNSVIKNNVATGRSGAYSAQSGGVKFYGMEFSMTNSALYNNVLQKTWEKSPGIGHDLYIYMNARYTSYYPGFGNFAAAKEMRDFTDPDYDFSQLVWKDGKSTGFEDKIQAFPRDTSGYYYTATDVSELKVAQIGDTVYGSLEAAFEAAKDGDRIELVSREREVSVPQTIPVTKQVTLDICDHTIRLAAGDGSPLFSVKDGASLDFANTQNDDPSDRIDGGITAGVIRVEEGGSAAITELMTMDKIVNNGDFRLDPFGVILDIALGKGKVLTLGEAYDQADSYRSALHISLDSEVLADVNAGQGTPLRIIDGGNDNMLNAITLVGITNSSVTKSFVDGGVVLNILNSLYLSGTGDDANDGKTAETAVKTFARAQQLLAEDPSIDAVLVCGTVEVADQQTWSLPEGIALMRDRGFKGHLAKVVNGGSLELKDIVVDGRLLNAKAALVRVERGGMLAIRDGAVLRNNVNWQDDNTYPFGGAVYGSGEVLMTGGTIRDNEACYGGGVLMEGGTFNMLGGIITANEAGSNPDYTASGGGVMLISGAIMNMGRPADASRIHVNPMDAPRVGAPASATSDGQEAEAAGPAVTGNTSDGTGGGIAIGAEFAVNHWYYTWENGKVKNLGTALVMNSGEVSDNYCRRAGGGIYIQDSMQAYIYGGAITNNRAGAAAAYFGGGGIYVNGLHSVDNWTYEAYNSQFASAEKDMRHGYLYLENVEFVDNTAEWLGGAIGTCILSKALVGDMTTAIHDNHALGNTRMLGNTTAGDNVDVFLSQIGFWGY